MPANTTSLARVFTPGRTLLLSAAVCIVCSLLVSGAAVMLAPAQARNRTLDMQRKVLVVAGLLGDGERLADDAVRARFADAIRPRVVDLKSGAYDDTVDAHAFDAAAEAKSPAPANDAKVRELPGRVRVYQVVQGGRVEMVIVPIEGQGLWSTLYGYLALATDGNTVRGITFYQHAETPGLGAEVDNPKWRARWRGRKLFDEQGQLRLAVAKGSVGPPTSDPHRVDGLSGATLTARGVTNMLAFWLGPHAFGPYLQRLKDGEGAP